MTGSFDLDKPVLLAAVVACGFSRQFGLNIYDSGMYVFFFGVVVFVCFAPAPEAGLAKRLTRCLAPKSFFPHVFLSAVVGAKIVKIDF